MCVRVRVCGRVRVCTYACPRTCQTVSVGVCAGERVCVCVCVCVGCTCVRFHEHIWHFHHSTTHRSCTTKNVHAHAHSRARARSLSPPHREICPGAWARRAHRRCSAALAAASVRSRCASAAMILLCMRIGAGPSAMGKITCWRTSSSLAARCGDRPSAETPQNTGCCIHITQATEPCRFQRCSGHICSGHICWRLPLARLGLLALGPPLGLPAHELVVRGNESARGHAGIRTGGTLAPAGPCELVAELETEQP